MRKPRLALASKCSRSPLTEIRHSVFTRRLPLSKILHYSGKDLAKGLAEPLAPIIAETAKQGNFSHVVAAHTAIGKNVLPRVAGLMDISQVNFAIC